MPAVSKMGDGAAVPPSKLFLGGEKSIFKIHPPQRRFKWADKQIDQLWKDLLNAHTQNRDSYFLGTLLVAPISDGALSVIDGQQRIATVSMLLAVLRDKCKDYDGLHNRSTRLQEYICRVDHDGNPIGALVVNLQEPDHQAYVDLVKQLGSTDKLAKPKRNELLLRAIAKLRRHVDEYIAPQDESENLGNL